MRYKIFLMIFILVLNGCKKGVEISGEGKRILVDVEKCDNAIELGDIYTSEYIVLESSKNSLIGNIDKICFTDSTIYVLDRDITNSFFLFKKDGSFIRKISKKGRGPGEYLQLDDFEIDESKKEIHLYCGDKKRILIYNLDGKYKESIVLSEFGYAFNLFPSGKYLTISTKNLTNVTFWSAKGKKTSSFVNNDNLFWKLAMPIVKYNNTCLINFPFRGDIYQVEEDKLEKKFCIDFGSKNFPIKEIKDVKKLRKVNSSGQYARLGSFEYFEDILLFNFFYQNRIKYGLFLGKKDKTIISNQLCLDRIPCFSIKGSCEDGLILTSDASMLIEFYKMNQNKSIKLPDYYNYITENSNPVIAILKLKQ